MGHVTIETDWYSIDMDTAAGRGDEYPKPSGPPSPHVADRRSIMHIGHALRARHFRKLLEELDDMIPDARFAVGSIG